MPPVFRTLIRSQRPCPAAVGDRDVGRKSCMAHGAIYLESNQPDVAALGDSVSFARRLAEPMPNMSL